MECEVPNGKAGWATSPSPLSLNSLQMEQERKEDRNEKDRTEERRVKESEHERRNEEERRNGGNKHMGRERRTPRPANKIHTYNGNGLK